MLTKVTAYSPRADIEPLVLNIINRSETDLFEVRNIDGLGAVKADINTTRLGSVNKDTFTGSSFGSRNIVLTLGLDPDWDEWTVSRLRRHLDRYFMPTFQTRLVFESMEFSPVGIFGYIESNEPNMFSKDPEQQISIICPEPDFVSDDPIFLYGLTTDAPIDIDYRGNLDTGFTASVHIQPPGIGTSVVIIRAHRAGEDTEDFILNPGEPLPLETVQMSSIAGKKSIKSGDQSMLNSLHPLSKWPFLRPGTNQFSVTAGGDEWNWSMAYYEHFGSL